MAATAPAAPLVGALAPIAPLAPLSADQLQAIRNAPRSSQSDSGDAYSEYAEDLGVEPDYSDSFTLILSRNFLESGEERISPARWTLPGRAGIITSRPRGHGGCSVTGP